jgi:hypothetical protein
MLEFLARGSVVPQGGACDIQRSLLGELDQIEGRHGATRSSKQHHVPARTEDVQTLFERGLAHRVIDDIDTFAPGQAFGFRFEVLLGVMDDFVRASLAFSSVETVAITRAPMRCAICTRS